MIQETKYNEPEPVRRDTDMTIEELSNIKDKKILITKIWNRLMRKYMKSLQRTIKSNKQ